MDTSFKSLMKMDGSFKSTMKMECKMLDMWTPYKELFSTVEKCIVEANEQSYCSLQMTLQKYKQNFLNILKNPVKNQKSRATVTKGLTEGINIPQLQVHIIPKEIAEESFILSDMYNLDELIALNLLCTAQYQMPSYPGLPRGLVAVLLYYDGHKALAATLRTVMQARCGIHWEVDIAGGIPNLLAKFSDELVMEGLIENIIGVIQLLDLTKEIEMLYENRAVGGPKHHHTIVTLFEETKQILADIVFLYSAQAGLHKKKLFTLIDHLRDVELEVGSVNGLDNINFTLHMAFMFSIDINVYHREDLEVVSDIPLFSDNLIECLSQELKSNKKKWKCTGLWALSCFAFGITLRNLRNTTHINLVKDEEDTMINLALKENVFSFLYNVYMQSEMIHNEEFYARRLHNIITDFIVTMPFKITELRTQADEVYKTCHMYTQQGVEPPENLPRHFEMMLLCFTRLYGRDPLGLKLHLDYWFNETVKVTKNSSLKSMSHQVSLFKFLCLTGDALPPMLFVPYLKLIGSLIICQESARQAFMYLKQNAVETLEWNHFFRSFHRYYSNLQTDKPPVSDTIYRHRPLCKGILPMEMQGLQAVLFVIRNIAEYDEVSRLALCENSEWSVMNVFLGLITCPIDITLKSDIILTLAALCKSPKPATCVWYSIESLQLIRSVPSISKNIQSNAQSDLEEVECRNEEYPLTRAMLKLLDTLTDNPVPEILGSDTRSPGFDPFYNYIMRSVFLPFNSRSYKNPSEKWEIGELCMKLFLKFVNNYEPEASHFNGSKVQVDTERASMSPPPGFNLMVDLFSSGEFCRALLYIIDEGCRLLETYKAFRGKSVFESLLLNCLKLVENVLTLQQRFIDIHGTSETDIMITPFSIILQGINFRTGKPDHILNITKYVTYNSWLQIHALTSIKILLLVTNNRSIDHSVLISFFTSTRVQEINIRHGFVECMEYEDTKVYQTQNKMWYEDGDTNVSWEMKLNIMKLLLQCLPHPAANISHYLFGFNLKSIKSTIFLPPGINSFPRTCLHSVLLLLSTTLLYRKNKLPGKVPPELTELAYRTLYKLCANPLTSDSVLRFLRASQDFLQQHMLLLPFNTYDEFSELTCMSWLLKNVAIELRVLLDIDQKTKLQELCALLSNESSNKNILPSDSLAASNLYQTMRGFEDTTNIESLRTSVVVNCRIYQFVKLIVLSVPEPQIPHWQFIDASHIPEFLKLCEIRSNPSKIDIKNLRILLMKELSANQSISTSGQRQLIYNEIEEMLSYAAKVNKHRESIYSALQFFDAWRKLTLVFFTVVPDNVMPFKPRFSLLMELILTLLQKVVENLPLISEFGVIASEIIMLLLVDVRQSYVIQKNIVNKENKNQVKLFFRTFDSYFKEILDLLVDWILATGSVAQKTRINLYTCLLTYLHLYMDDNLHEPTNTDGLEDQPMEWSFASRRINSKMILYGSFSERLVDTLCKDAINTSNICQMLALSCLDLIMEIESKWISFISSQGYLRCLIRSLADSEQKLADALSPNVNVLSSLYIYESKMTFLCRIAYDSVGAEFIVQEKALNYLAAMDLFSNHPAMSFRSGNKDSLIPDIGSRYLQLFTPVLSLCKCIILSLGTEKDAALLQVLRFLINHNETVSLVLRSGSPHLDSCYLKELDDLTCVISSTFSQVTNERFKEDEMSSGNVVKKMQKLMLSLMVNFDLLEADNVNHNADESPEKRSITIVSYLKVILHALLYTERIISISKQNRFITEPLLQPVVFDITKSHKDIGHREACISTVMKYIVDGVSFYMRENANLDKLLTKAEDVPSMTVSELKEMIPVSKVIVQNEENLKNDVVLYMNRLISGKKKELSTCYLIIETALYLLWTHLDYYMLQAIPAKNTNRNANPFQMHETAWKASLNQLNQLQESLILVFHDTFVSQLISITNGKSGTEKGYVEALVRRIKKLVQFVPNK